METLRYGNDSPPPPPYRSARMNLGIFRDMQRPEIVNSSIPIWDVKLTNEESADATSRTEITCERLPSISLFAVGEPIDINSPIDEDSLTLAPTYSMYNDAYGGGAQAMENAYTEELEPVPWIAASHATHSYLFAATNHSVQDEVLN